MTPKQLQRLLDSFPPLARGDGSWGYDEDRDQITLRHVWLGKRHIERGTTTDECLAKRNRRRRDADERAGLSGDGSLGGLVREWREFQSEGKQPSTVKGYDWAIEKFLSHLGGPDVEVTNLTVRMVEAMWTEIVRDGVSEATLLKLRTDWSSVLGLGARRDLLPGGLADKLRQAVAPPTQYREREARWYDLDTYWKVRRYLIGERSARNALFLTMMLCGLRPGEAMGLRWDYVDLPHQSLRVEGAIARRGGGHTHTLKTDHIHQFAHRRVPIPKDLWLVLSELERSAEGGWVFGENGRPLSFGKVNDHSQMIALTLRIPHVNPNGYRHTFASVCRHNGMPYEQLAKLMGHQDAKEIIRTYGHPIVDVAPPDMDKYLGGDPE